MLTRIRHQVVRPWIRRPRAATFAVTLVAALSASSAFAQCRGGAGGSGGTGGSGATGGTGGTGGAGGTGLAGFGAFNQSFGAGGQGQNGHGFFSVPSEQMFEPAFQHVVDDNRVYLAERRALRAARVEQARQRLAWRKEKPAKHRVIAANMSQE
jgi:hypothetical protein